MLFSAGHSFLVAVVCVTVGEVAIKLLLEERCLTAMPSVFCVPHCFGSRFLRFCSSKSCANVNFEKSVTDC
jgi:hypothetical protein